jgi:hypothetical protein
VTPQEAPVAGAALPEVLSAEAAARFLGVSKWALYDACNRPDGPPHRRIGRRIVFSRQALVLWLGGATLGDAGEEKRHASVP